MAKTSMDTPNTVTQSKVTLHLGDCLEYMRTMADGCVNIVITSPPYNINGGKLRPSGMFKDAPRNVSQDWYDDFMPEEQYQEWIAKVVIECARIAKGLVWINHKTRYKNKKAIHPVRFMPFPIYSEIIWNRGGSITLNAKKFAPCHEFILGFGEPDYWNDESNSLMSVWNIGADTDANKHPCAFPLSIPRRLIVASCYKEGIVFDPFMGSGTTGVAAVQLGRNFIGCEIDENYFKIAEKRIKAAQAQLLLPLSC